MAATTSASTRQRILQAAGRLFTAQGVSGTGTAQILAEAQAPRGSLYHHFPDGKSQLVVEALAGTGQAIDEVLQELLGQATDPPQAVTAFVDRWAQRLQASGWRLGCPVTTAALELAADDEAVRVACDAAYRRWQDRIAAHLIAHGHASGDAAELAETIVAVVEGALVLARVRQDRGPLDRAARQILTLLDRPAGG